MEKYNYGEKEDVVNHCLPPENNIEKENIIKGWICDFYPTINASKYELGDEILKVPLKVKQYENGENKNLMLKAGIWDLKQDPDNYIVEPIVNYNFSFEITKEKYEENKDSY